MVGNSNIAGMLCSVMVVGATVFFLFQAGKVLTEDLIAVVYYVCGSFSSVPIIVHDLIENLYVGSK